MKMEILEVLAECTILSLPQVAQLTDRSLKSTRDHLRDLFDMGLVKLIAVPRVALAGARDRNDHTLLYGRAPNIYTLTREGVKVLSEEELIDPETLAPIPDYGPRNSRLIAHELKVRDVRVWLKRLLSTYPSHRLSHFETGTIIDLNRPEFPRKLLPDAWFIYEFGTRRVVGFVEVDRGTERGTRRWEEKVSGYMSLFSRRDLLKEVTGFELARLLVITPDLNRTARLCELILSLSAPLAQRTWLAPESALLEASLSAPLWYQPGGQQYSEAVSGQQQQSPVSLIPQDLLVPREVLE